MTASFPTTVKSFTAVTDGVDYPEAVDINSLQEETAAVETYLLTSPSAARVTHSTTQSIANSTFQALTFDTETFDTDTMHSAGTNPTRLTAITAGKYVVTACAAFASNATGARIAALRLNGSQLNQQRIPAVNGYETMIVLSDIYNLAANDYVEVFVFQDSGAALNVISASTSLAMCRMR